MKIFVTDADERAALAVTRSLGGNDEVHVLGSGTSSLAGASRYAAAHHRVPSPAGDPSGFADAVERLAQAMDIEMVVPVTDFACDALLPRRERLRPATLAAPELRAYERLSDKIAAAELALSHGIEVPPGSAASTLDEALQVAREIGYPVVVKPSRSVVRDAEGRARKADVRRARDEEALAVAWRESVGEERALVQQFVPGCGEGLFLLRVHGRTCAAFAHRRIREKPPTGGVSVLRESIPIDYERLSRVEAILDAVGFEGLAMAEFKTDGQTSWLMEFNARVWGSLQLAIDAGIDFPRLLVRAAAGDPPATVGCHRYGLRLRWLLGDLDHAIAVARGRGQAKGWQGLAQALGVMVRPTGPSCRWEVLRRDDPRPFGYELRRWLQALVSNPSRP